MYMYQGFGCIQIYIVNPFYRLLSHRKSAVFLLLLLLVAVDLRSCGQGRTSTGLQLGLQASAQVHDLFYFAINKTYVASEVKLSLHNHL